MIPNALARSETVSLQAKGLYMFIRSHSNGWRMSTKRIAEVVGVGRDTVGKYIRELEECGYVVRRQVHCKDGTFGGALYEVYSTPVGNDQCRILPLGENTDHGDSRQHKNTNSFKKTNSLKENQSASEDAHGYSEEFEKFFQAYPRKNDKLASFARFKEQLAVTDVDTLMRAVNAFRAECDRNRTEKRYIPMCKTWLNQGRWRDYEDYHPRLSGRDKVVQMNDWLDEL